MTIELFVTVGVLDAERKHALAERILYALTTEDDAPDTVLDKARELTHVLVREPDVWATGGPAAPRYLVRLTVPGSWSNNPRFADHVVPMITEAIAATEPDPERLTREPHCVIQIVGLRERGLAALGRPLTGTEITELMTEDYRNSGETREAPEGFAIDPICGMTVELATAELTLTHNGTYYAFCAPTCRKLFTEEHAIPA
ncbi:ATPase [Nocardia sp. bgisy118]|uniref:ATPase n=1 Tax=Nocardia sp. bgisy118 TaxID=3413786 RepID=UPI003F4A4F1F